jgi:hypothetical protein
MSFWANIRMANTVDGEHSWARSRQQATILGQPVDAAEALPACGRRQDAAFFCVGYQICQSLTLARLLGSALVCSKNCQKFWKVSAPWSAGHWLRDWIRGRR